jgi:hypothetical protein
MQNPKDLIENKCVHLTIEGYTYKKLRALLFLKDANIQTFMRMIVEKFVNGDEYIEKLIEQRVRDIKQQKISMLKNIKEKDLYNAIEENSSLDDK